MKIVLASSQANALAAKKALSSGQSWATVVKKYSIDPTTKSTGGVLNGVTKQQEEAALSTAAFAAPANKLLGPVKGQFGYYVFEVTKIVPGTQQTLAQASSQIKQQLTTAGADGRPDRGRQHGQEALAQPDDVPFRVRDVRLQRLQGAEVVIVHLLERDGDHGVSSPEPPAIAEALARLDAITRRLRVECPWDREQDERSIVPHTVEESYELADAARRGDDAKMLDELGDVLFQVHFLALLLEERGAGDLARVATDVTDKLIRRHPHVFGDVEAETSHEVRRNWDQIKQREPGREPGVFGEVPENLPAPLYARKLQRRAATSGFDFPGVEGPLQSVRDELAELEAAADEDERFHELGDVLFAVVNVARKLAVDPELALRAAADRFRARVQAGGDLAASEKPELERSRS